MDAGLDDNGLPILRVQREVSRQREAAAAAVLKAELSALPGDDARRESFMSAQACKAARSFWQAIPHSVLRLKNRFWAEVVSNSFGLASPAMAPWVGTLIGDTGLRVDPRGDIFFTSTRLCNKYGARTIWSSAMELELRDTLREADVTWSRRAHHIERWPDTSRGAPIPTPCAEASVVWSPLLAPPAADVYNYYYRLAESRAPMAYGACRSVRAAQSGAVRHRRDNTPRYSSR